ARHADAGHGARHLLPDLRARPGRAEREAGAARGRQVAVLGAQAEGLRTAQEAELSYENRVVGLHDLALYRPAHTDQHVLTTVGRILYNDRIFRALAEALGDDFDPDTYNFINQSMRKKDTVKLVDSLVQAYG